MTKPYDALVFDLDDTLFETTEQLTNPSFEVAFRAMIQSGLCASVQDCFFERQNTGLYHTRESFFVHLVQKFGTSSSREVCFKVGNETFQKRVLELEIYMPQSTRILLEELSTEYSIFLVTAGARPTQIRKVELLGIGSYFDHMFFVETRNNERKRDAFYQILKTLESSPDRILSIGNRLDIEIKDSRELGLKTCHVLKGEHSHVNSSDPLEIPDYTIKRINEIKEVCHL